MNLLHLDSSILGENSVSRAISAAIVSRLQSLHPDITLVRRDLAAQPPAHLDLDRFAHLDSGEELQEYLDADIIVIGAGLYNFTVPSQLKAWLDRIVVRGKTFTYGKEGAVALAPDKRVIIAMAKGNVYHPGTPFESFEHGETLLNSLFRFLGVTPEFINASGVNLSEENRQIVLAEALEKAGRLGAEKGMAA